MQGRPQKMIRPKRSIHWDLVMGLLEEKYWDHRLHLYRKKQKTEMKRRTSEDRWKIRGLEEMPLGR
jgi:hypothetical protein